MFPFGLRSGVRTDLLVAVLSLFTLAAVAADYSPDPTVPRDEIPLEYQWQSKDIFPNDEAWAAELEAIKGDIPKLLEFQGRLGESAATLLDAHNATYDTMLRLYKLYVYSQTLYDVDQGNGELRQMQGQVAAVMPTFGEATNCDTFDSG